MATRAFCRDFSGSKKSSHNCDAPAPKSRMVLLMTKHEYYRDYYDRFEYHGNTPIEFVRKHFGAMLKHDGIIFNTIEEATEFFNECCGTSNWISLQ